MPGGGATVLRRASLEKSGPGSGFVVREAMRRPLRVVYADHSHLEHHGAAAGDVTVVLLRPFELVRGGFDPRMCEVFSAGARQRTRGCSPRGLGGGFVLVQGL